MTSASAKNPGRNREKTRGETKGETNAEIRRAREDDISHILALVAENSETLLPRSQDEYMELLPYTWVAEEDGQIVGCASLEIYSPKIAEIRSVAVTESHRHRGYGRALVMNCVIDAKERQIHEIMVVTSNRAFFEQMNFGACLQEKYALFWSGK